MDVLIPSCSAQVCKQCVALSVPLPRLMGMETSRTLAQQSFDFQGEGEVKGLLGSHTEGQDESQQEKDSAHLTHEPFRSS